MEDFFFRTEDIRPDEVLDYFVESSRDRQLIDAIKGRNPTIIVGSRGVGKSFLMRVAQQEMLDNVDDTKVCPVYLSFVRSSLISAKGDDSFKYWMIARICSAIIRTLRKTGLMTSLPASAHVLSGSSEISDRKTRIEEIAESFENSWKNSDADIRGVSSLPSVDDLKDAIEDICDEIGLKRICLLFDEAAHIFLPEQQRQFFTLFRDLRSHCITCNAAVYPGVTSFGETFQPAHDATMLHVDRDISSNEYIAGMREIVEKQADASVLNNIAKNGENFAILAYAASGNPRILLKTISRSPKINSSQVNETIREYFRTDVWSEHTVLGDKYSGHRKIIDWGRHFLEAIALPEIKSKNDQYLETGKNTSAFVWIHRDAPAVVKEALRLLAYTGVVSEQAVGIKATRAEVGVRYIVNLGCLFAIETTPTRTAHDIASNLDLRRMTEFGANHVSYRSLVEEIASVPTETGGLVLDEQLQKPIKVLDLSYWQRSKLTELGLSTVGEVLNATEAKLQTAHYVGSKRARRMRNAAEASVLEYLSG